MLDVVFPSLFYEGRRVDPVSGDDSNFLMHLPMFLLALN